MTIDITDNIHEQVVKNLITKIWPALTLEGVA
jgi:hypothetical protein